MEILHKWHLTVLTEYWLGRTSRRADLGAGCIPDEGRLTVAQACYVALPKVMAHTNMKSNQNQPIPLPWQRYVQALAALGIEL